MNDTELTDLWVTTMKRIMYHFNTSKVAGREEIVPFSFSAQAQIYEFYFSGENYKMI